MICMLAYMCVCVHLCACCYSNRGALTRKAPVELALCDQPSVVAVKVLVAGPDVDTLVLVELLASLEEGLYASTAVVPGGGAPRGVFEGLGQRGDGLQVGLAVKQVRVEGWGDGWDGTDGMVMGW